MCKHELNLRDHKGTCRRMKPEKDPAASPTSQSNGSQTKRTGRARKDSEGHGHRRSQNRNADVDGRRQGDMKRPNSHTPTKGIRSSTCHGSAPTTPSARSVSRSPIDSTANAYAGAKFSEPPSPKVLPKPPVHWFSFDEVEPFPAATQTKACSEMTSVLKVMLNVQA